MNYRKQQNFWDEIFAEIDTYNPHEVEIENNEIGEALSWLAQGAEEVLDFGFGTGRMVYSCLKRGAERILGIEMSRESVKLGQKTARAGDIEEKTAFFTGGVEKLEEFENNRFDAVILSNVLDNMLPKDGKKLIQEVHRTTREEGKILVKLNNYLGEEELASLEDFSLIEEGVFQDERGVYLWNIGEEEFKELIKPYFTISAAREITIESGDRKTKNRLYLLLNSKSEK